METVHFERVDGFLLDDDAYVVEVTGTNRFTMSHSEAIDRPYVSKFVKRRLLEKHGWFSEGETSPTRAKLAFVPSDDGWDIVK